MLVLQTLLLSSILYVSLQCSSNPYKIQNQEKIPEGFPPLAKILSMAKIPVIN